MHNKWKMFHAICTLEIVKKIKKTDQQEHYIVNLLSLIKEKKQFALQWLDNRLRSNKKYIFKKRSARFYKCNKMCGKCVGIVHLVRCRNH